MFNLDGKCALVTGASGGIGAAIARALHDRGAVVALSGTRGEVLEGLAHELGERAHVTACDLSDSDAVAGLEIGEDERPLAPHFLGISLHDPEIGADKRRQIGLVDDQ